MSDVQFYGTLDRWTLGEPPRLEIVSRPDGNSVAQSLALLKQRILSVSIHEGAKDDEFCALTATLPLIASSVGKAGKGTRVKLDIDPRELTTLLRLLALGDKALRFVFRDSGAGAIKREPKPAKQPTPHGRFWRELDRSGFHNRPDVRAWLSSEGLNEPDAKDAIRRWFAVESRAKEISPQLLIRGMQSVGGRLDLSGAITMVENAKAKVEREGANGER